MDSSRIEATRPPQLASEDAPLVQDIVAGLQALDLELRVGLRGDAGDASETEVDIRRPLDVRAMELTGPGTA